MTLNNLLLTIILIVWIVLLCYKLMITFDYIIIFEETFHLQVVRAILIVISLVSFLFYGINIYYAIYFTESQEKENALIAFTSIF